MPPARVAPGADATGRTRPVAVRASRGAAATARPADPPRGGRGEATRARILAAARAEFAARGFVAGSMRAVAARAGVDIALVYHYFASKSALAAASLAGAGAEVRPADVALALRAVLDGVPGAAEALDRSLAGVRDDLVGRGLLPDADVVTQPVRTALLGAVVAQEHLGWGPSLEALAPEAGGAHARPFGDERTAEGHDGG